MENPTGNPTNTCKCGCGSEIPEGTSFKAGHYAKWKAEQKRMQAPAVSELKVPETEKIEPPEQAGPPEQADQVQQAGQAEPPRHPEGSLHFCIIKDPEVYTLDGIMRKQPKPNDSRDQEAIPLEDLIKDAKTHPGIQTYEIETSARPQQGAQTPMLSGKALALFLVCITVLTAGVSAYFYFGMW